MDKVEILARKLALYEEPSWFDLEGWEKEVYLSRAKEILDEFCFLEAPKNELVPVNEKAFREWLESHHCPDYYADHLVPDFMTKFGSSGKRPLDKGEVFKQCQLGHRDYIKADMRGEMDLCGFITERICKEFSTAEVSLDKLEKVIDYELNIHTYTDQVSRTDVAKAIKRELEKK